MAAGVLHFPLPGRMESMPKEAGVNCYPKYSLIFLFKNTLVHFLVLSTAEYQDSCVPRE